LLGCVRAHTALILATVNPLLATAPTPLDIPCLVPLANRPLLFHLLDDLVAAGLRRAIFGAPPVALTRLRAAGIERERWPLDLHFRVLPEREDPVRAVAAVHADGRLDGSPTVVHLADCRQPPITLSRPAHIGRTDALLFVADAGDGAPPPAPDGDAAPARWRPPPGHRLTGVQVLGPTALEVAAELAGELDGAIGVERLADRIADRGGHVATVPVDGCWRFEGRIEDVLDENRRLLAALEHRVDPASLIDSTVHGTAVIHPSARLTSTLVRGPVAIGPGAELTGSYVGPYTAIGADALLEGTEIENSIVGPGARLRHVGLRIDASVIGRDGEIGRDFRLPKALRVWVGDRAQIALS
jgi:glucose-1-phosphate thymidylyltransferase